MSQSTRTRIAELPMVELAITYTTGTEEQRRRVLLTGVRVVEIVYGGRRHRDGESTYGWRPAGADPRGRLSTQVGTVRRLLIKVSQSSRTGKRSI